MRAWLFILALGCDQGVARKAELLPTPVETSGPDLIVRDVPPPPPGPTAQPAPEPIRNFLREHGNAPGPWRITLRDGKRRVTLRPEQADEFVTRLASETSYVDGDVGCVGDEVSVRIMRGEGQLDFIYDCGHVYLDEAKHDGAWVLFSSEMVEFFEALRSSRRT